ncbi:MAG: hypothetical protein GY853_06025 [PVC group bacterium]|nr:hypothetical protein [PVC group bacterium]
MKSNLEINVISPSGQIAPLETTSDIKNSYTVEPLIPSTNVNPLANVVWEDIRPIHPMLDFTDTKAYVGVNLDFNRPPLIESVPHIIGSDGTICAANDIVTLSDKGLRLSRIMPSAPRRWKKTLLKEYIEHSHSVNVRDVFENVRKYFQKYVYFTDQATYSFITLWVIGTYLHPIFDAFPLVLLCGPKGSGKSRTLLLTSLLAFNARLQGDPTAATVFRIIEQERPTLIFDEMEWLSQKTMNPNLSAIFKFGYKKGCRVPRCAFDSKRNPYVVEFDTYCPKMFANIHGLEDVLGDRTITFYQRRKTDAQDIETLDPSEKDPEWAELRHSLYIFMLTCWREVKRLIPRDEPQLKNRDFELFSGIIALASFFEKHALIKGLYDEIVSLAVQKAAEKKESDKEMNHESILIQALLSLVTQDDWYTIPTIINTLHKFFHNTPEWINDLWTGRSLARIGIGKPGGAKKRRWTTDDYSKGKYLTCYFITKQEVEILAQQYGVTPEPLFEQNSSEATADSSPEYNPFLDTYTEEN